MDEPRARSDPQYEMGQCGSKCGEAACYTTPAAPYVWNERLNHSARFHSDEQDQQGYFAHDSACSLVANIDGPDEDGSSSDATAIRRKVRARASASSRSRLSLR